MCPDITARGSHARGAAVTWPSHSRLWVSAAFVHLRASPPQVVAQDVVFPENVDVSLQDIGGLEPVEDILVNQRMLRCAKESMSFVETWAQNNFKVFTDKVPLGFLQKTKVLLPLQRPDLFQSNLLRLNKGILLYGNQMNSKAANDTAHLCRLRGCCPYCCSERLQRMHGT